MFYYNLLLLINTFNRFSDNIYVWRINCKIWRKKNQPDIIKFSWWWAYAFKWVQGNDAYKDGLKWLRGRRLEIVYIKPFLNMLHERLEKDSS